MTITPGCAGILAAAQPDLSNRLVNFSFKLICGHVFEGIPHPFSA
jgi:hypothetical protein